MGYIPLRGIIVSSEPYREKDKILIIFTDKLGKIRAKIRSVRSGNSKRSGFADDFLYEEFLLYKRGNYYSVTEAKLLSAFLEARLIPENYFAFLYLKEMVLLFSPYEQQDLRIFNLLKDTLFSLSSGEMSKTITIFFLLKFLEYSGNPILLPETDQEFIYFNPEMGGFTRKDGILVSSELLKEMKSLSLADPKKLCTPVKYEDQIIDLLNRFISYHTGSKHFMKFLETIKKLGNI